MAPTDSITITAPMADPAACTSLLPDGRLLRLLHLVSPTLPIGGYSYSHGMEMAVERGWVTDQAQAGEWIRGILHHCWVRLDGPILWRLHGAMLSGERETFDRWCAELHASRETAELLAEDAHLGRALLRVLAAWDLPEAAAWFAQVDTDSAAPAPGFAAVFAAAAALYGIGTRETVLAWLWNSVDSQVAAAVKLVPLGQTAGQALLLELGAELPVCVARIGGTKDDEITGAAPGLALASALHETQHTRLFRS
jgi:urease accessory protein